MAYKFQSFEWAHFDHEGGEFKIIKCNENWIIKEKCFLHPKVTLKTKTQWNIIN
jgi:hypothetical protein